MKNEGLNPRLSCAAGFVRQGAVFADIGTDHAYLPLFLLEEGIIERAVCSDINEGPLESARRNAAERGLSDRCAFLLADGACEALALGATDVAICGMGGELIADIVKRSARSKSFNAFKKAFLGDLHKFLHLRRNAPDFKRSASVAMVAVFVCAQIHADDIAFF